MKFKNVFVSIFLTMVLVVMQTLPVFANSIQLSSGMEPTTPDNNLSISVAAEVPMVLDCDSLTGAAKKYAEEHNYCPSDRGGVSPDNIVVGDCGSSWLFVTNLGAGQAAFDMGAASTVGAIAYASYNTGWINWDTSVSGSVSGFDFPYNTNWYRTRVVHTEPGYVYASMHGGVTLTWGGTCTFLNPNDSNFITD
jgi:hypothetical protein